ncbi:hypothetical protein Moror_11330 [Moniliophthora roreri MCA 2997]|uniref:Uncharacterized protein n=1 Tax=Moniliophthora roreri (strain MCA 2997) TaxID=1381753 RepID=V2WXM6_MONRO|nr:hypothetical protein Moror_11330 [Moniliophthora roreri MCA 2997]
MFSRSLRLRHTHWHCIRRRIATNAVAVEEPTTTNDSTTRPSRTKINLRHPLARNVVIYNAPTTFSINKLLQQVIFDGPVERIQTYKRNGTMDVIFTLLDNYALRRFLDSPLPNAIHWDGKPLKVEPAYTTKLLNAHRVAEIGFDRVTTVIQFRGCPNDLTTNAFDTRIRKSFHRFLPVSITRRVPNVDDGTREVLVRCRNMGQARGLILKAMQSGDPIFGTSAVHYPDNLDGRFNQAPFWGEEALAANIKLCYLDWERQVRPGFFRHIGGGYLDRLPIFGWKQEGRAIYLNVLKPSDAQMLLDKGIPGSQFEALPNANDSFTVPHEVLIAMRLGASRKIVLRNLDPQRLGGLDAVKLRMKTLLPKWAMIPFVEPISDDSVIVSFQNVLEGLEIMLRLGDGVLRYNPKWEGCEANFWNDTTASDAVLSPVLITTTPPKHGVTDDLESE